MPVSENLPPVPLTVEGSFLLHQMFRVRWPAWRALTEDVRKAHVQGFRRTLAEMKPSGSALFSLLGHKADLMLVHFRGSLEALGEVERQVTRQPFSDFLESTTSYISVVELGLYESTGRVYATLAEQGVIPHSAEWNLEIEETLERQRTAMQPRLYPAIPPFKHICFYPMDRLRGEHKNWYQLSMLERQRQMSDHGEIGRRYAGKVKQIISGSIGFDDWEWGVDLFADDPLVFKRLIYEMRFDEASAVYAKFGAFYIGQRLPADDLETYLDVT